MRIHTLTPQLFKKHLEQTTVFYSRYETAAGQLIIVSTKLGIFQARFADDVLHIPNHYIYSDDIDLRTIVLVGTDFQIAVWHALLALPEGTISYSQLAEMINYPTAHRAVANAVGQNNIAYFVPCHRIVRKNGGIGGYRWGIEKKKQLLESEAKK